MAETTALFHTKVIRLFHYGCYRCQMQAIIFFYWLSLTATYGKSPY